MSNKMLHRGSNARLISTKANLPALSTCVLLLIQFQTSTALPTSTASSQLTTSDSQHQGIDSTIRASQHFLTYGPAYPYGSYRPGARLDDSYRPYNSYPKDPSSFGLYAPEARHPNSVYSSQSSESSSFSQHLGKAFEILDTPQQLKTIPSLPQVDINEGQETFREQKQINFQYAINSAPVQSNKPRLRPLPSVQSSQQSSMTSTTTTTASPPEAQESRSEEFSSIPPPFAPELDPQYERRQYGLGALSLLDQAGPFW